MPKGTPKDTSIKRKLIHQLKIARGHLDHVIDMVENDAYCIDVIHQSHAVQSSLKKTSDVLLKNHLETCVSDAIKNGKTETVIDEVMKVVEKG